MKNLQAVKAVSLLNSIIEGVLQNGIITNTVIDQLKELRPHTITEELPLLAKATRLAAEHIDEFGTFAIPIPEEESIEEEGETLATEGDATESFHYFLCLIRDVHKKANEEELRVYVKALQDY